MTRVLIQVCYCQVDDVEDDDDDIDSKADDIRWIELQKKQSEWCLDAISFQSALSFP